MTRQIEVGNNAPGDKALFFLCVYKQRNLEAFCCASYYAKSNIGSGSSYKYEAPGCKSITKFETYYNGS